MISVPLKAKADNPDAAMARYRHRIAQDARCGLVELEKLSWLKTRFGRRRRLSLAFLNSDAGKLHAAAKALSPHPTEDAVRRLAETVRPFDKCPDPVFWHYQQKTSGTGHRVICELPSHLKAAHYMVAALLQAQFVTPEYIYAGSRRGRDCAVRDLKAAMEAGYNRVFVGDIRDCFQHVAADALPGALPLPRAVVENILDYRNLHLRRSNRRMVPDAAYRPWGRSWNGPQGLLQGSPASNIILAYLLSEMGAAIASHDCRLFVISDNIAVATRSDADRREIIALIRDYLHEHPAGPFELKNGSHCVEPGHPFEFLGYELAPCETMVRINRGRAGLNRFEERLERAIAADIATLASHATLAAKVIQDHFAGYPAMTNRELSLEDAFVGADDRVQYDGYEEFYAFLLQRMGKRFE